ncbi:uncharacterized protein METZ01_LOCUS491888, partial [marine metagenome]
STGFLGSHAYRLIGENSNERPTIISMQRPRGFLSILIIFAPLTIIGNCSGRHAPEREKHHRMQV